jgi:hypothetical protein
MFNFNFNIFFIHMTYVFLLLFIFFLSTTTTPSLFLPIVHSQPKLQFPMSCSQTSIIFSLFDLSWINILDIEQFYKWLWSTILSKILMHYICVSSRFSLVKSSTSLLTNVVSFTRERGISQVASNEIWALGYKSVKKIKRRDI